MIALGRACDMIVKAADLDLVGCKAAVPSSISSRHDALRAIRNAYAHIEDRALGQVNRRPNPAALTGSWIGKAGSSYRSNHRCSPAAYVRSPSFDVQSCAASRVFNPPVMTNS